MDDKQAGLQLGGAVMAQLREPPVEKPDELGYLGTYEQGAIHLAGPVDWAEGTRVTVNVAETPARQASDQPFGKVIIAGFGLAGRWVADIFNRHKIPYVIVDQNPDTIRTQRELGHEAVLGDIAQADTLNKADLEHASILALTIPDEAAVLQATCLARKMKRDIYIVVRTSYSSSGMRACQLGADEVIKAEQTVARQFYEMMLRKLGQTEPRPSHPCP
jgi:hypothetical protein